MFPLRCNDSEAWLSSAILSDAPCNSLSPHCHATRLVAVPCFCHAQDIAQTKGPESHSSALPVCPVCLYGQVGMLHKVSWQGRCRSWSARKREELKLSTRAAAGCKAWHQHLQHAGGRISKPDAQERLLPKNSVTCALLTRIVAQGLLIAIFVE